MSPVLSPSPPPLIREYARLRRSAFYTTRDSQTLLVPAKPVTVNLPSTTMFCHVIHPLSPGFPTSLARGYAQLSHSTFNTCPSHQEVCNRSDESHTRRGTPSLYSAHAGFDDTASRFQVPPTPAHLLCPATSATAARLRVLDWNGDIPIPAIPKPKPLWTGKQIPSLCIPRGINIYRSPDPKSSNPVFDDGMMAENGGIVFGTVEKKTVGASQGGLVHVIFGEKGPEATGDLAGLQMVVNYWLFHNGFSIGIGDTIADKRPWPTSPDRSLNGNPMSRASSTSSAVFAPILSLNAHSHPPPR